MDNWLQNRQIEADKKVISPSYLNELRRFVARLKGFFQDMDIRDIGTKKVNNFCLALNGSPKYILNIMSCFHKMLSDALNWGDIGLIPKLKLRSLISIQ